MREKRGEKHECFVEKSEINRCQCQATVFTHFSRTFTQKSTRKTRGNALMQLGGLFWGTHIAEWGAKWGEM